MARTAVCEIVAALSAHTIAIVHELLPGGRRCGPEWECPSEASPLGARVCVRLTGPRAGCWGAWAADLQGDILGLVAHVKFAGQIIPAIRWAETWLRLEPGEPQQGRAAAPPGRSARPPADRGAAALQCWRAARPLAADTPPARYLERRGLPLAALGRIPALRWRPALRHAPSDTQWPALVAAVWREGEIVAVHRTWLTPAGEKAPVDNPKMVLGPYAGGLIPLAPGEAGDGAIYLTEGIEDGLTARLARPRARIAAVVSLPNLGRVRLPRGIATIVILAQNDPWWHDAQDRPHAAPQTLAKAVRQLQRDGRQVRIARPKGAKDINDLVRHVG